MKSDIVNNLKLLRQKTGMSQKELASKLGVSQNAVYNWENGKREMSIDTIERVAALFDIAPSQLMGWEQIDSAFSGREASPETYDKLKTNIEKHHGKSKNTVTIAAHFDGDEYTADELEEIRQFAEFVKSKRKKDENF